MLSQEIHYVGEYPFIMYRENMIGFVSRCPNTDMS